MDEWKAKCANCEILKEQIELLRKELEAALKRIAQLEEQLAKARKNSSNSSKPPSSDIVNPAKARRAKSNQKKRKRGAQKGHPRHERTPFAANQIDKVENHRLKQCPDCGGRLKTTGIAPQVVQQVEIVEAPISIEEHRSHSYWCARCRNVHYGKLPDTVEKGGLVGPRLTALIAYMKGACHASYSTIRKYLRDVVGVTISRGQLVKAIAKVKDGLAKVYEELYNNLALQPRINVDETGHKENGQRLWTWCFRAELYTLFKIDPSRSADVLIEVLGDEFNGVLGCDYFSAYRRYMRECGVLLQFCLAHLIRDVKFLTTLPGKQDQAYGRRIREALRHLFEVIHQREEMTARDFQLALKAAQHRVIDQATNHVPRTRQCQNLANRFRKHGEAYFQFITTPGVEPTNNLAEQAIRFVVIDRYVTQGTRSANGRQWCERIWTAIATCTQQSRSVFDFIYETVLAYFTGSSPPSLLTDTS